MIRVTTHLPSVVAFAVALFACSQGGSGSSVGGGVDGGAIADGGADAGPYGRYAGDGPYAVTSAYFTITSPNATYGTTAYVPSGTEPAPVVLLAAGFFQQGVAYAAYAERLASWGVVTLTRSDPGVAESTADAVADVGYEIATWLPAQNADATSALHGKLDLSRVGLTGHSRGAQIALLAAEALPGKIQGVFGIDPVDSTTAPEASASIAAIGLPLAFIGETTDDADDGGCAPANVDFLALYADAVSPAVAMTVPGADHTMFEDPNNCTLCSSCTAGTADQALVESTAVRYLTAYFARQLLGDTSVGATFAGAGATEDVSAGTIQLQSK